MQPIKLRHGKNLSTTPGKKRGRPIGTKKKEKLAILRGYVPPGTKEQLKAQLDIEQETESKLIREFIEMYLKVRSELGDTIDECGCSTIEVIKENLYSLIYRKSNENLQEILEKVRRR